MVKSNKNSNSHSQGGPWTSNPIDSQGNTAIVHGIDGNADTCTPLTLRWTLNVSDGQEFFINSRPFC